MISVEMKIGFGKGAEGSGEHIYMNLYITENISYTPTGIIYNRETSR